jgi:Collagen triple helix repeat (20 copies)
VTENGSTFIARSDNVAVDPAQSSIGEWALLAAKGAVGPIGPQGPAGPVGVQGPIGPAGAAGVQGNAGPAGATSAVGPIGPAGPIGAGATVTDISPSGPCGPVAGVSVTDGAGNIGIVCDGATGATGPTGPSGTAGQSSVTFLESAAFTASPVAAPTVPPIFFVTGLNQTISVPAGAAVHIQSTGGVQTQSTTVPGFSVLDVLLFVDGVSQPGGWIRLTAANVTTADKAIARWNIARSFTLAAGSHTIAVAVGQAGAAGGGSIVGSAAATVGGVNPSPLQGTLTITILKQ